VSAAADDGPLIFLIAGEASGDMIGAHLMEALKAYTGGRVRFAGIGGEHMSRAGLDSLFPMRELSLMGIVEILPHIPKLLRRIRETEQAARRLGADVVVTIDAPEFCFRVAKRLKASGCGIPVVHYVAPQVWAWRAGRARTIAEFLDYLLLLFDFEEKYFAGSSLKTVFVGHHLAEADIATADGAAFRRAHAISSEEKLLAVLPGSRHGEIVRHLPVFGEVVNALADKGVLRHVVIPAMPALKREIAAQAKGWRVACTIIDGSDRDAKYAALAASDAALTSSGTATLELAIAGVPMVVAYRANPLTVAIARRVVRVEHIALANIVAGHRAAPEFLQQECTAARLVPAVENILLDAAVRDGQIEACRTVARRLGVGGAAPSELAAKAVLAAARGVSANKEE
jgi:lipid-A-disaccharide synthase